MILLIVFFYFGCCFGSFAYCLANHWTRSTFKLNARSSCHHCHKQLAWYELFPLFSYLFQYGRCNHCKLSIPSSYWIVEAITGLLFVHFFYYYSEDSRLLLTGITLAVLFIMSLCDICDRWVPDSLQLLLLVCSLLQIDFKLILWLPLLLLNSLLLLLIYYNWIGGADVKLLFTFQLLIPIDAFPVFLFIASLSGLLFMLGSRFIKKPILELPFVPFLSLAYYCILIYF